MAQLENLKSEVARDTNLTALVLAKIEELKTGTVDQTAIDALTEVLKTSNDSKEAALA